MCGIFGLIVHKDAGYEPAFIKKSLTTLARLSESRGKDSSGLVFRNESERELQVFKGAVYLRLSAKKEGSRAADRSHDRLIIRQSHGRTRKEHLQ